LLTHLANRFEAQKHGSIAVISSVAGDRGRQSNYVYGTAKGAVTIFLQGLRNRLHKSGVQVLTIKPGFVDTPMTAGIYKKGPLWAAPEAIARSIQSGIEKRRDVIYTPLFWMGIMSIIKAIPEWIFKKLKL
jgi:short-subunit dehydrogenase